MERLYVAAVGLMLGIVVACADPVGNSQGQQDRPNQLALTDKSDAAKGPAEIEVYDDCDPNDPAWAPTGGCTLRGGKVTEAEFNLLLTSPLSQSVVGHPAWRNEPSYLTVDAGKLVRIENEGGRFHTFTNVAQFGGGRIPPLNQGLTTAPECILAPGAVDPNGLPPDGDLEVSGLSVGIHRFQCCIHPWMRALIKVHN